MKCCHVDAEEDPESGEESHQVPVHGELPVSGGGVHAQGQMVSQRERREKEMEGKEGRGWTKVNSLRHV